MTGSYKKISLLLATAFFCMNALAYSPMSIKVKVAKNLGQVQVSGLDLQRTIHSQNDYRKYSGRKRIRFNCKRFTTNNEDNDTLKRPHLLASLSSPTGLISLEKNKFQGKLHVVTNPESESCDVINEIPLEYYISTLLAKEMNAKWPVESLKAQAVAARSYALHKIYSKQVKRSLGHEGYYDLESSEKHQVSGNFFDSTKKTALASYKTKGEVLVTKEGKVVPVFFHASCGGRTLRPDQVWTNKVDGYKAVHCGACEDKNKWNGTISSKRLYKFLKWVEKKNYLDFKKKLTATNFRFLSSLESSNVVRVYVGDRPYKIKKAYFRRYFGRTIVDSNHFDFEYDLKKKIATFKGQGLGHGVGMCQIGARRLAVKNLTYKQILKHYFPDLKLVTLY